MASGTPAALTQPHEVTVFSKSLGMIITRVHRIFRSFKGNLFCTYRGETYRLQENNKGYFIEIEGTR